MYYMKCYMQTTIPKPNKRQEPSEVNGQNQSQVTPKPKAKSQKPWAISQVKPSEAKAKSQSQKPKAKWARKWEILAPKCTQNTDFSSKMQQIARKAAPGWKTENKYIYTLQSKSSSRYSMVHILPISSSKRSPNASVFCAFKCEFSSRDSLAHILPTSSSKSAPNASVVKPFNF